MWWCSSVFELGLVYLVGRLGVCLGISKVEGLILKRGYIWIFKKKY